MENLQFSGLRLNAFYVCSDEDGHFDFLCFFGDGRVISAVISVEEKTPSRDTLEHVNKWFNADYDGSSGRYALNGNAISFNIAVALPGGKRIDPKTNGIDYKGFIQENGRQLVLDIFSHITGHHNSGNIYRLMDF